MGSTQTSSGGTRLTPFGYDAWCLGGDFNENLFPNPAKVPVARIMASSLFASGARKAAVGLVALLAGSVILTSGPRSLEGLGVADTAPSDPPVASVDVGDDPPVVMWDVLAALDYRDGTIGDELSPFVGKEVRVPGFMVPLEDFANEVSEFLLVPYVGACVHTPPPPPNQLVYVKMEGQQSVEVSFWDPVWIYGKLEVEETENVYGSVSFLLSGTEVKPYEY